VIQCWLNFNTSNQTGPQLAHDGFAVFDMGLVHFAKNLNRMNSTAFVLFGKYCLIVEQLGSKDSSRYFQLNCVISYFLLIFNTPYKRLKFDVMERE
jgi:hypothetical protein